MEKLLTTEGILHKLKNFDIPEHRIRINRAGLEWLKNNLPARNSQHPDFETVMLSIDRVLELKQYSR